MQKQIFKNKTLLALVIFFVGFFCIPSAHAATTRYMPDDCANLQACMGIIQAGDTLIIRDGTYSGSTNTITDNYFIRSSTTWTTIQAEHIGSVIFDGQGSTQMFDTDGLGNLHWIFRGIQWNNSPYANVRLIGSSYFKFIDCGATENAYGDSANFYFGNSSYFLVEGGYTYGGARYSYETHSSDHGIFRDCVSRIDYANPNNPMANYSVYSSSNILVQNSIAIDTNQTSKYTNVEEYGGCFMVPTTAGSSNDVTFENSICVNSTIGGLQIASNASASNIRYTNMAWWGISEPNYGTRLFWPQATTAYFNHVTIGGATDDSVDKAVVWNPGGSVSVNNSIFQNITATGGSVLFNNINHDYNNYNSVPSYSAASHDTTINARTSSLLYPVRIETGSSLATNASDGGARGATMLKKIGTPETLWGETGYDTITTTDIWPFRNEDLIKTKMAAYSAHGVTGARGFTTGTSLDGTPQTLTKYIWEYLGNQIPADIYGPTNTPITTVSPLSGTYTSQNITLTCNPGVNPCGTTLYCWGVGCTAATTYTTPFAMQTGTLRFYTQDSVSSANNEAIKTATYTVDSQAPTTPTNLLATTASYSQINLTWTASTDNNGVTGYKIYRNGSQVGTSIAANYSDTGLSGSTTYTYKVSAYDSAGNESSQSTQTQATTPVAPALMGHDTMGASVDSSNANNTNATRYTAPQTGDISSISVYVSSPISASPNNQFQVAIYADNSGTPGSLIAQSQSGTLTGNAWNTLAVSATLQSGTNYWLAYNTNAVDASSNNTTYDTGTTGQTTWRAQTFGTWPNPFGTPAGSSNTQTSIYASYTTSLVIRGDVDQNSSINTTDALLTLRNSLGLSMTSTAWQASATTGDVNCDGNSNSTDALLILRYSLGLSMTSTAWCEG